MDIRRNSSQDLLGNFRLGVIPLESRDLDRL